MADFDEDIFDDLYDEEPKPTPAPAAAAAAAAAAPPAQKPEPEAAPPVVRSEPAGEAAQDASMADQPQSAPTYGNNQTEQNGDASYGNGQWQQQGNGNSGNGQGGDDGYGPINVKEDGKMFIGGLNWETTEDSLKSYFSQYGEVSECTVMRDSATGRSRGFGFLTFRDPKCVNIVMVKEHYLDGKIIDPKRAIPREEQERTSKIFVGGVSQEATEQDFKNFFKSFGRVVDATLMMDKDTGRPRGFGFVTFDGDAAVDACLAGPLQILGKPIEVKRAQPRGNMREEEDNKKFGRNKFGNRDNNNGGGGGGYDGGQNNPNMQQGQGGNPQMTPAMLAQYWQRMQQYFRQMQEGIAAGGMANPMGGMPPGMNPAMMGMMGGMNPGAGQGPMGGPGMNPMMAAQFQNMQGGGGPGGPGGYGGGPDPNGRPNIFNPQDQLAFEQQKYEQQQQRRMQQSAGYQGAGGPTSWEGMYDEIPQPSNLPSGPGAQRMHGGGSNYGGHGKHGRGRQGSSQPPANAPNAPANAPTGPKNAGKPGANYRGGGRGGNFRHNPYGGRG